MFKTRELALLIWVTALIILVLVIPAARKSVAPVLRAATHRHIIFAGLATCIWMAGVTWVLYIAGIWSSSLWSATILLTLGPAFTTVFNLTTITGKQTFAGLFKQLIGIAIFVEVCTNLWTFPLWVELLIVPATFVIALIAALPNVSNRSRSIAQALLLLFGVTVLVVSFVVFVTSADKSMWIDALREVAYTVLALALFVPFALGLGIYHTFTSALKNVRYSAKKRGKSAWAQQAALVRVFAGRTAALSATAPADHFRIGNQDNYRSAVAMARKTISDRSERQAAKDEADRNLLEFAGIEGQDERGAQLDRREFRQTKSALSWLHTCMMGNFRNDGEYRISVLRDKIRSFESQGLPDPHGVTLVVRDDGQAWYAWRRTITGWVFAIGQNHLTDEWRWDGSEEPPGFPLRPESEESTINWRRS